ncbi:MAG: hypothetical protein OXE96_16120 [Gemmatimonadetes bacterium]|nr:hypothetical protein [Gemmatimonadota bacterium]
MSVRPTGQLRMAMFKYGLLPKTIVWDHRKHRFPGKGKGPKNDAGWYRAFADRRGAVFGDYSQGDLYQHWKLDHDEPIRPDTVKRWEREREKRDAEKKNDAEQILKELTADWEKASKVVDHPYLTKKGITNAIGIRQLGDTLLIPAFDNDGNLSQIQRIFYHNARQKMVKLFYKHRSPSGCRFTIGGDPKATRIYLTEGWATGEAIHQATGAMVVVAFNDYGLITVGKLIRKKFPDAHIIVCADNDQWSTITKGKEEIPNPGVTHATEAARAISGILRVPYFKDLEGKPTDYDDLRQREGMDQVVHWLKHPPPKDDPAQEADKPEEKEEADPAVGWQESAPFRCLGHNDDVYYFLPRTTGQLIGRAPHQLRSASSLIGLNDDLGWWINHWPGPNAKKTPVDLLRAMTSIMKEAHGKGVFLPERLRGLGAWRSEDDGVVLHLGDRLLAPGESKYMAPEEYRDGRRVYPRLPRVIGPSSDKVMSLGEAQGIVEMFQDDILWEDEASGIWLAGWVCLAPFSGALGWRPHIWIAGGRGCGKSTIQERLVEPLLGEMCVTFEGASEAAIRHGLHFNALPVVYDAAERDGKAAPKQFARVIKLLWSSSGVTTDVIKGATSGKALVYKIRAMFCMASIGEGLKEGADKSRVTMIRLRSRHTVSDEEKAAQWGRLQRKIARLTPAVGQRLIGRTAKWFRSGDFDELLMVSKSAATAVMKDSRNGDQYGTLGAGAWMMSHDDVPEEHEMREWYRSLGVEECVAEQRPEGWHILSKILQAQEILDGSKYAVGQLVEIAAKAEGHKPVLTKVVVDRYLRQLGLRVMDNHLYIGNGSEWVPHELRNTPFQDSWTQTLRTIKGVHAANRNIRFHPGLRGKSTAVPLSLLDID